MFCSNCGSQLSDESLFCSKCGKPTKNNIHTLESSTKHKVTIFRESQIYLVNPPVNISINNKMDRSIENGGSVELELEEGRYKFEFSMSFRKKTIDVNVNKDIQLTVKWNRFTGALVVDVS